MGIYDRIKHDIDQEYYASNYSNEGQRFVAWYLRNIRGLDEAETKSCVTDGADDNQIDAVYISHEDEIVYIIQGKFTQKAKLDSKPVMEVRASWAKIKNLQHLQENANDKLSAIISEISSALDDDYNVQFELIATSGFTQAAIKEAGLLSQELSDDDTINASLDIVDIHSLERKYNNALGNPGPGINHSFTLEPGRFLITEVNNKRAVIAVISLLDCLNIPGIKDGSLFRKNVRHSLGNDVKVNKEIAASLKNCPDDFFFMHNGITAICSSIELNGNVMSVKDLSVVNGCQSLTTISHNSETVKKSGTGYVMFRFYETIDNAEADTISTSTNSQNAVKPRDLRSNDKYVLALKKSFEQRYTDGQFITKRGEKEEAGKNPLRVIDLATLGKLLMTWHMQWPTRTHVEKDIFVTHFDTLFHHDYASENVQALNEIYKAIMEYYKPQNKNPLEVNEALFKQKAYAPYWHLFAIVVMLCEVNKADPDMIPIPEASLKVMRGNGIFDDVIRTAGQCLDVAFMADVDEARENGIVFNPPNWFKSTKTLGVVRSEVRRTLKNHKRDEAITALKEKLKMSKRDFEPRWGAE